MIRKTLFLSLTLLVMINLIACASEFGMTGMPGMKTLEKPDEHTHVYEAKEKFILRAIASVIKKKKIGDHVTIDEMNHQVNSDFVVSDDWRTKTNARVKRLDWKECEVSLMVTTEKKTSDGWELRRLLGKEQYETFFYVIELQIYEEMSKAQ